MFNLMGIKEFSKEMNKPESTIRTWIRRGEIPSTVLKKIGSTVFIRVDKFQEWIDSDD